MVLRRETVLWLTKAKEEAKRPKRTREIFENEGMGVVGGRFGHDLSDLSAFSLYRPPQVIRAH
jgi:hypothetical protein